MIRSNQEHPVPAPPSVTLGSPVGELVLRIREGNDSGRDVRLTTNKCSIGSSADCSVQLSHPGIQPVHCVIFRGAGRTVVRRWAANTWLNGEHFVDAELKSGDCLRIQNIQIEVFFPEVAAPNAGNVLPGRRWPAANCRGLGTRPNVD